VSLTQSRLTMVAQQIQARGIVQDRILSVMREIPRHEFVSERFQNRAYEDKPLPIGFEQTISQPYMVAAMTEIIDPGPGQKVLEIGTGCGYQTAILSALGADVYSLERLKDLSSRASAVLSSLGLEAHLKVGNGHLGWSEAAPFDRILVACAAEQVPDPLLKQLAAGGRLLIPVGPNSKSQVLTVFDKDSAGQIHSQALMRVRFVPFVNEA
jgi:protein-L-isoaspartate(D-aspartate) O-methyltransferase